MSGPAEMVAVEVVFDAAIGFPEVWFGHGFPQSIGFPPNRLFWGQFHEIHSSSPW